MGVREFESTDTELATTAARTTIEREYADEAARLTGGVPAEEIKKVYDGAGNVTRTVKRNGTLIETIDYLETDREPVIPARV